jgi:hypothetical protein
MRRIFISLSFALVGLGISYQTVWADDWRDNSNYPAKAISMTFGSGVLDSSHSVRFGSWTVSYGPDLPLMNAWSSPPNSYYATQHDPGTPLVCSNPVLGQDWCILQLSPGPPWGPSGIGCFLRMYKDMNNMIIVPCPTSIAFQH